MLGRLLTAAALTLAITATGCNLQRPVETIRVQADRFYERGEYDRAAEEYAEIAARYPGDWRAQHRLGRSLMQTGDLPRARRALELAWAQRPGHEPIADDLAEVLFRIGEERQLFSFLRERAEATQSVDAYRRLAHYAIETGDPDTARLALETAIALDGGQSVEPYIDAADFAETIGDLDTAIRRLRQALSIDPHDERVRSRLRDLGEVPGPSLALPPGR